MAKSRKKGGAFVVVLVSILCCILTFALTLLLVTSLTAYRAVQKETLVAAVEGTDLNELRLPDGSGTVSLAELIAEEFIDPAENPDPRGIEKVLADREINDFAAGIVSDYNTYLRSGGSFPHLRTDEFLGLLEDMEEDIYAETGLRFGNGDVDALEDDLDDMLDGLNATLTASIGKGVGGFAARAACSIWGVVVPGVLLVLLLVWLLVCDTRRGFRAGTALKTFGIPAFLACLLLLLAGFLSPMILGWVEVEFLGFAVQPLSVLLMLHAGIGLGVSAALFLLGMLLCRVRPAGTIPVQEVPYDPIDEGIAPAAPEASTEPEASPEQETPVESTTPQRRYCRNCGKVLVNPDARFCYHCGNVQEHVAGQLPGEPE